MGHIARAGWVEADFVSEADDLETLYSPEYLRECAAGGARQDRLDELKRRIALHAYRVDTDSLAAEILRREIFDPE
jgi:anti-sigma28 factor (negative regulator of flagellin synthesis)